jgi:hypothetical protein
MTKLNGLRIYPFFREAHMESKEVIPLSLMRTLRPAKDAFYPSLKNYSHPETKLLPLKLSTDVKNVPIGE